MNGTGIPPDLRVVVTAGARRAVPALRASGNGALINLSSVAGRLGYPYRSVYAATKWAAIGFTQSLAKEYVSHVSLRRKVSNQDVANMILFLCSEAGRNVSGQSLGVCGNVEAI